MKTRKTKKGGPQAWYLATSSVDYVMDAVVGKTRSQKHQR